MGIRNREPSLAAAVRELLQARQNVGRGDAMVVNTDLLDEVLRAVRPALKEALHGWIQEAQAEASEIFAALDKLYVVPPTADVTPRFQVIGVCGAFSKYSNGDSWCVLLTGHDGDHTDQENYRWFTPAEVPRFQVVPCPLESGMACGMINPSKPHHHFRDADGAHKIHETVPKEEAHSECLDDRCPGPAVLRKTKPSSGVYECDAKNPLRPMVRCTLSEGHDGMHQSGVGGVQWNEVG